MAEEPPAELQSPEETGEETLEIRHSWGRRVQIRALKSAALAILGLAVLAIAVIFGKIGRAHV